MGTLSGIRERRNSTTYAWARTPSRWRASTCFTDPAIQAMIAELSTTLGTLQMLRAIVSQG